MTAPSSTADRMRRLRERRSCGLRVYPAELGQDAIEAMVRRGLVERSDIEDKEEMARVLGEIIESHLGV